MRVLVTGSSGYLGRALVPWLAGAGHDVAGLSAEGGRIDVADHTAVDARVEEVAPDVCIHLAGRTVSRVELGTLVDLHVNGTVNVMEAVHRYAPGALFLSIGSAAEYGVRDEPVPFDEADACRPTSDYGISKFLQTEVVRLGCTARGIRWSVLRLFNVVGPAMPAGFFLSDSLERFGQLARAGDDVYPLHSGDAVRDFISVDLVKEAVLRMIDRTPPSGIYNLASGRGVTIRRALEWIGSEVGGDWKIEEVPRESGRSGGGISIGNPSRLQSALDWAYDLDPERTFRELVRSHLSGS